MVTRMLLCRTHPNELGQGVGIEDYGEVSTFLTWLVSTFRGQTLGQGRYEATLGGACETTKLHTPPSSPTASGPTHR